MPTYNGNNGNGNGPKPKPGNGLGQTGNYGYCVCGLIKNHIGACRPKGWNPSARPANSPTQWDLPPMGHGFPRRDINITPQEELYDHDKVLGGREFCETISPPGPTVLQQPRLETSSYVTKTGFDPSEFRILEPLLEKFQHIYPRFDSETVYATNCTEVGPGVVGPPPRPTIAPALTFDTTPGVVTYIRHIETTVFDGLVPPALGVSVTIDGNPVKYIAQPVAATSPPTYGVQPQTPNFPTSLGMPIYCNDLLIIPDRHRVIVQVANFDTVATREVCVSLWGWLTPFMTYGR